MAVNSRRPVFAESPEGLQGPARRDSAPTSEVLTELSHAHRRAGLGGPAAAGGRAGAGRAAVSFTRPQKISQEDGVFLEALAGQCALAVERATLFEREHKTAETLQRSLLPDRLPDIEGLKLAKRFRSARATCRSAATGTTRSSCRTGGWRPSWAT